MNVETPSFAPIAPHDSRQRPAAPAAPAALPAAAVDAIFANLARRQERSERGDPRRFDAKAIRDTAAEMDRQGERLAQLLRDIDAPV
jgi:hypothetical protein